MPTRRADRVPHFINMPKFPRGKKEFMERRGERIYMAQYYHKVNADIAKVCPQSSDIYEEYKPTGIV